MTAPPGASRRDLAARAAVVVAAGVVGAVGVWWPVSTLLAALAVMAVAERVVRLRRRGRLDAVLVGVGGLVVTLILLGLLLDAVPGGLTRVSWSVALGLVGLGALVACRRRPGASPFAHRGRLPRGNAVWSAVALGLTVLAVAISVTSANDGESPPLQLSVRDVSATHAEIVVRGGSSAGVYQLAAGSGAATRIVRGPFHLGAGQSIVTPVTLDPGSRLRVSLDTTALGTTTRTVVRSVILDNTGA